MAPLKSIVAPAKAVDPSLNALFASSVGPVQARAKPKYEPLIVSKPRRAPVPKPVEPLGDDEEQDEEDDDDSSEDDSEEDIEEESDDDAEEGEDDEDDEKEQPSAPVGADAGASKRKRKKRDEDEDLEVRYLEKISRDVEAPAEKRVRRDDAAADAEADGDSSEDDADDADDADEPIVHESLLNNGGDAAVGAHADVDKDKAARTVFLSNVSIEAVTSKAAKRTLLEHLSSVGKAVAGKKEKKEKKKKGEKATEDEAEEKDGEAADAKDGKAEDGSDGPVVESLRFRSVPFATASLPKRAAFITKAVMGATAHATNAYVVYTTAAAARAAVRTLNGTVVLGRHLRADSVAHPAPVDHRRCVFVGNLGFVDDETVVAAPARGGGAGAGSDDDGDDDNDEAAAAAPTTRKRHKVPMDVDEGLWRTFGKHAGRVESVRVVRDPTTRVGKGIAYVQFYDANAVEAALLLADKKFPPLLPRPLRVSRCKAPHKTARAAERTAELRARKLAAAGGGGGGGGGGEKKRAAAAATVQKNRSTGYTPKRTAEQQTLAGRAAKLLGRAAAAGGAGPQQQQAPPVVFEGMRARVGHNSNLFKKNKNNKKAGGPNGGKESNNKVRRAKRAANWKKK